LYIGYVGPDNLESLIYVHKITSLLNKTHIMPYKIDLKERPTNVFFVGTDQTGIRAKVIIYYFIVSNVYVNIDVVKRCFY